MNPWRLEWLRLTRSPRARAAARVPVLRLHRTAAGQVPQPAGQARLVRGADHRAGTEAGRRDRRAAGVGHGTGPAPRTGLVGQSAPGSGTSVPSAHPPPREEWTVREGGEMQTYPTDAPDDLRQLAISQLRKRRGLQAHAL